MVITSFHPTHGGTKKGHVMVLANSLGLEIKKMLQ